MPISHIVDTAGLAAQTFGVTRFGLLGTKVTMKRAFYHQRVGDIFDLGILATPPEQ